MRDPWSEHAGSARSILKSHEEKIRFLLVGAWNTAFAYVVFAVLYSLLGDRMHYVLVLIVGYPLVITQNFVTFKSLVFMTKGNWLAEYPKMYVVYAGGFLLNIMALAVAVELLRMSPMVGQLSAIALVVFVSYLGHKYFTFRSPSEEAKRGAN